jgi:hypothetical protein
MFAWTCHLCAALCVHVTLLPRRGLMRTWLCPAFCSPVSARVKVKKSLQASGAMSMLDMVGVGTLARTLLTGHPEGDDDATPSASPAHTDAAATATEDAASGAASGVVGAGTEECKDGGCGEEEGCDAVAAAETGTGNAHLPSLDAVSKAVGGLFSREVEGSSACLR